VMMSKILRYISGQFSNPTGLGGRLSAWVMNQQNQKMYHAVEKNLHITETDTILDIGFGNGYLLRRLSKHGPKKLYGVDISKDMIKAAGRKNKAFIRQGKMELFEAGAENLPFADASIDKAYTVNTIYFWQDLHQVFFEINRTLKPGGIFLNVFYLKEMLDTLPIARHGYAKYTVEQIKKAANDSGLKAEHVIEIQPQKSVCVVVRKE
jgi:ubiquinone/menaquinone biosynthesis C-methylase UbiE